jgi:hypothetical protein
MIEWRACTHALQLLNANQDLLDALVVGEMWCAAVGHVEGLDFASAAIRDVHSGGTGEMIGVRVPQGWSPRNCQTEPLNAKRLIKWRVHRLPRRSV